ncbi:hypothetical protein ES703_96359 [subsurface metagenome]
MFGNHTIRKGEIEELTKKNPSLVWDRIKGRRNKQQPDSSEPEEK